jgi:hypothetical protein
MHPKAQIFILFLQWATLIALHKKNDDILKLPKHMHFLPIWDHGGVIPRNILNKHFTPTSLLE